MGEKKHTLMPKSGLFQIFYRLPRPPHLHIPAPPPRILPSWGDVRREIGTQFSGERAQRVGGAEGSEETGFISDESILNV